MADAAPDPVTVETRLRRCLQVLRQIAYPPDGVPRTGANAWEGNMGPSEQIQWPEPRQYARQALHELEAGLSWLLR